MANLTESSTWESGIYRLEESDPIQGGVGGISNTQSNQLANRTKKIYDTLAEYGIFINVAEQEFVGQHAYKSATFELSVVDGDAVYWDSGNARFAKALADGSVAQYAVGIADVTNGKVVTGGMIQTALTETSGDIIYLSSTVAGELSTVTSDIVVGRYEFDGVITWTSAASASASSASIAPGSITPTMLQESYYTQSDINSKCSNWDTAYNERKQWDGGSTNLDAATARTSLGLYGDISTHNHDSLYYTKTEINSKCPNWDSAYSQTFRWNGTATCLNAGNGRTALGLTGDVTTHCHNNLYYTEAESDGRYGRLAYFNTWYGGNHFYNNVLVENSNDNYILNVCNDNANGYGIYVTTSKIGIKAESVSNAAIIGYSTQHIGVHGCAVGSSYYGVAGSATGGGDGVYGGAFLSGHGVVGCSFGSGAAVAGNTAYCQLSSKYLKHLENVCITKCLLEKPLKVYRYYWGDSNTSGFSRSIGPMAEDFNETFGLNTEDPDGYEGIWSVDGIALGLGIENMNEIEKLKKIITKLYSCVKKQDEMIISLQN